MAQEPPYSLHLNTAGIGARGGTAALALFATPATRVAVALAGPGLVSCTAIPGAERLLDWREGKKTVEENGLHYLLDIRDEI